LVDDLNQIVRRYRHLMLLKGKFHSIPRVFLFEHLSNLKAF
jgi:hypothetical protein